MKIKLLVGTVYRGSVYPQFSELDVDRKTAEAWIADKTAVAVKFDTEKPAETPAVKKTGGK